MAYRFSKHDRDIEAGVRRIALEEIDSALHEIDDTDLDPAIRVHQLRKRTKRLRGLIRLVQPGFDAFDTENAAIRDMAGPLSTLRNSAVVMSTHDALYRHGDLPAGRHTKIGTDLQRANASGPGNPASEAAVLAGFRSDLLALRTRAAQWRVSGKDRKLIAQGMGKTLSRARRAMRAAKAAPGADTMHEWRKWAKMHWYHCRLFSATRPARLKRRARLARALGEDLGDHNDLAVYLDTLDVADPPPETAADFRQMRDAARARQAILRDDAFAEGHALFDEKPKRVRKRWARWWQEWRGA